MLAEKRYEILQNNVCWTTDPDEYQRVRGDTSIMLAIWRELRFGGDLPLCPILVTDDTEGLSGDGSTLACYRTFTDGSTCIVLDVTACVVSAFFTRQTLYKVIAESLLHEMVHHWCRVNGIKDTEADGTHNEAFRDAARAHGLTCRKGTQGFNRTRVRPGGWQSFMRIAEGIHAYDAWRGFDDELMPTLASLMRTTHVAESVAWALMAA